MSSRLSSITSLLYRVQRYIIVVLARFKIHSQFSVEDTNIVDETSPNLLAHSYDSYSYNTTVFINANNPYNDSDLLGIINFSVRVFRARVSLGSGLGIGLVYYSYRAP